MPPRSRGTSRPSTRWRSSRKNFYLDGIGVERSVEQARRWFTAAAEQGGEYGEAASLELEELRSS